MVDNEGMVLARFPKTSLLISGGLALSSAVVLAQSVPTSPSATAKSSSVTQQVPMPGPGAPMSEALRASITNVVLMPGESPVK
jgi:hypothetical protein